MTGSTGTDALALTPAQAALARAMAERELQKEVRRIARLLGWRCYHTRYSLGSDAGFPDLVLVREDGRLLFIELKAEGKNPSYDQAAWLDLLEVVPGVLATVWRPSDLLAGRIHEALGAGDLRPDDDA